MSTREYTQHLTSREHLDPKTSSNERQNERALNPTKLKNYFLPTNSVFFLSNHVHKQVAEYTFAQSDHWLLFIKYQQAVKILPWCVLYILVECYN